MKTHFLWLSLLCGLAWSSAWAADQTATWNGSTGNWSDAAKWSTNPLAPNNGNGGFTFDVTQSGGTLTLDQAVTVEHFQLSGGTFDGGTGFAFTCNDLSWIGGTLSGAGTINSNGSMFLSGSGTKTLNARTLNNSGGANWTTGNLSMAGGSIFNNASLFQMQFNGLILDGGGAGNQFNNLPAGTFTKSGIGGSGAVLFLVPFNNAGTVNVNTGRLVLNAGGTHSGVFNVANDCEILLGGGVLNAGTSFAGLGTTVLSLPATVNGSVSFDTRLRLSGGELNGEGLITVTGPMTMDAGAIMGTAAQAIDINGGLTLSGSATFSNRTVNANSNTSWTDGTLTLNSGAIFNNLAAFTVDIRLPGDPGKLGGTQGTGNQFNNQVGATFTNSALFGAPTSLSWPFNNLGTVNANSGTLSMSSVIQHSGTTLTGGTWNVNGATLGFTNGSNIQTNQANVTLSGAGSTFAKFTAALNANQGSLTLKNNRDFTTAGAFANSGVISVEDAPTLFTVTGSYTQTAGSTTLKSGAGLTTTAFNLNGGTLAGTGTINGPLVSSGVVSPGTSAGVLTVNGSTTLNAGMLAMEIGGATAGTQHDQLVVNGALSVGGVLELSFINGFESAISFGDTFTLATATSPITGAFTNVPSGGSIVVLGLPGALRVFYSGNSLVVVYAPGSAPTAVAVIPASIAENQPASTVVGTLSASDPFAQETFTFTLVSGAGSDHNAAFEIVGTQLRQVAPFNFEQGGSKTIRVRVLDAEGLSAEFPIAITITDGNDLPVPAAQTVAAVEGNSKLITLTAADEDVPAQPQQFKITSLPASGTLRDGATTISAVPFTLSGATVTYTASLGAVGSDGFQFRANDGIADSVGAAAVTLNLSPNAAPVVAIDGPGSVNVVAGTGITKTGTFDDADGRSTVTLTATRSGTPIGSISKDDNAGTWSWSLPGVSSADAGTITITTTDVASGTAGTAFTIVVLQPDITVRESPAPDPLIDPAATSFGSVKQATIVTPKTFTITNDGTADLTGLVVTKHGTHSGDFILNTSGMSTTLAPGASTSFTVDLSPSVVGERTAAVHIGSNDLDENPFDINFSATVTPGDLVATWNGTNGTWSDPAKWNTAPLFPNNGNGDRDYDAVQSAGILTLDQAVTLKSFQLNAGTFAGGTGFTFTLNNGLGFAAGSITGPGTIESNGSLVLSTTSAKFLQTRTLNSAGGAIWTAGSFLLGTGATFNNRSIFQTNFDGSINSGGGAGVTTFNNELTGTFTKSAGTGTTTINIPFNNSGIVNVNSGKLSLPGGGAHAGAFNVAAGSTLLISGLPNTLSAGATITGAGLTEITGDLVANAPVTIATPLKISGGGTLDGAADITVSGPLDWDGAGNVLGSTGAALNITGGLSLNTVFPANPRVLRNRTVNAMTNTSWTGGSLQVGFGAIFNNQAVFDTNFDGSITTGGGAAVQFNNQSGATFTKSSGTGTTSVGIPFNNSGTVNVNTGTLSLSGGGSHAGAYNVVAGSKLVLTNSGHVFNAGGTYAGAGTVEIISATVPANAPVTISTTLKLSFAGILSGPAVITVSGPLDWSGGSTIIGSVSEVINVTGGMFFNTVNPANPRVLRLRTLNAISNTSWTGGSLQMRDAILNNQAVFDTSIDGGISSGGGTNQFNNQPSGTFTKSGGAGTTTVGVPFSNTGVVNANSGTLSMSSVTQHSGTVLTGGTWNVNGATLAFTTGSNITTNQGHVTLNGAAATFARLTTALNNNQGSLTLKNDCDLTTAGAFANSGTISVQDASTVMTIGAGGNAAYTQTGGITTLVSGATMDPSVFNLNGGTLSGTGTISAPLTAITGAATTIAPGSGIGTLQTGSTNLGTGTTLALEFASPALADQLAVTGSVTLSGSVNLALTFSYAPTAGDAFIIIANDGTDAVSGVLTLSGTPLAEGAAFFAGGVTWTISYTGGTGNDVTLTATTLPAPSLALPSLTISPPTVGGIGVQARGSISGPPGAVVRLERSSNLTNWTLLSTITLNGSGLGSFDVTDPLSTDLAFFRLVIP